jgi:hypothetical protein
MKKILLLFIVYVLFSLSASAATFSDVPSDHVFYDAITFLSEKGIVEGYSDGTFKPDDTVTRAEAMKIIMMTFSPSQNSTSNEIFSDVKLSDWFFSYIMQAQAQGVVTGYSDGTFKPGNTVNLAELLKMLILSAKVDISFDVNSDVFADVPKDTWYSKYALYAKSYNLVTPDDRGNLNASIPIKRGRFSEIVYRLKYVLDNGNNPFPLYIKWPFYEANALPFKMKYDKNRWQIFDTGRVVHFFWADNENHQGTYLRIFPDTAIVSVAIDTNDSNNSFDGYVSTLKNIFKSATFTEFKIQEMSAVEVLIPDERIVDWYIELNNGDFLTIYTQFGSGNKGYLSKQLIREMLKSFEYVDKSYSFDDNSTLLSSIFESVLVEGVGMENLNRLPDKVIIETDTIGVGTGPVDYYYCAAYNYTFKYERNSDIILAVNEGETSAF